MVEDFNLLSRDDVLFLREMARAYKQHSRVTRNRFGPQEDLPQAPEVYVARTPSSGIAAPVLLGTGSGSGTVGLETAFNSADCFIYQLIDSGTETVAQHIDGLTKPVYSLQGAFPGNSWILVERDKFGKWWAVDSNAMANFAFVEITSTTPHIVYLPGEVGTATIGSQNWIYGYYAKTYTWKGMGSGGSLIWSSGDVVWFVEVNGNQPKLNHLYQSRFLGNDDSDIAIWGAVDSGDLDDLVKITSNTASSSPIAVIGINNLPNQSLTCYPATDLNGTVGWGYYLNGTPVLDQQDSVGGAYLSRQVGYESGTGKPVWQMDYTPATRADITDDNFSPYNGQISVSLFPRGQSASTAGVTVGENFVILAGTLLTAATSPIGNNPPPTVYTAQSGTDALGNVFFNGLNISLSESQNVGTGTGYSVGTTAPLIIDGGSDW